MRSILEQTRRDGRMEGIIEGQQIAGMVIDEAEERGRIIGLGQAPKRWPMFLLGMAIGAALMGWLA